MNVMMSADDTTKLVTANIEDNIIEKFNFILNHISKCFQADRPVLHPIKTKVLKSAPIKLPSASNLTHAGQFLPEV